MISTTGSTFVRRLGILSVALGAAMLGACAMPAKQAQQTAPSPQPVAAAPAQAPAPKAKATPPIDYKAIVKMVQTGEADEDEQIGKDVAFGATPLNKAGYMPIDTKGKGIKVYLKCDGGNTKPKGKTIGQLRSVDVQHEEGLMIMHFTTCRAA